MQRWAGDHDEDRRGPEHSKELTLHGEIWRLSPRGSRILEARSELSRQAELTGPRGRTDDTDLQAFLMDRAADPW